MRKENDFPDRGFLSQKHDEPVNADPQAPGRRHAVFERGQKILVQRLERAVFAFCLQLRPQTLPLFDRIVQFRITVRDLHAPDIEFKTLA